GVRVLPRSRVRRSSKALLRLRWSSGRRGYGDAIVGLGVGRARQPDRICIAANVRHAVGACSEVSLEAVSRPGAEVVREIIGHEINDLAAGHEATPAPRSAAGTGARWRAASPSVRPAKSFAKQRSRVQSRATRTFFSRRGSLLR